MEYVFPIAQNNGQISSSFEHVTGEQVQYQYDSLKRLSLAQTTPTSSTQWGQSYGFDGFGNLTSKTVTLGGASNWSQTYDPLTNHISGNPDFTYDANGNTYRSVQLIGYDVENRITSEGRVCPNCTNLWYDPSGKRVAVVQASLNTWTLYFYDIFGKRSATIPYPGGINIKNTVYFRDKLFAEWVRNSSLFNVFVTDRLGSVRFNSNNNERFRYLPYGEELTSTPDDRVKFGTYFRDSFYDSNWLSQDYADQRYYSYASGSFFSPDPKINANLVDPGSWNQYAYTQGDPVNFNDPSGMNMAAEGPPDFGGGPGLSWGIVSFQPVENPTPTFSFWPVPGNGGSGGGGAAGAGSTFRDRKSAQRDALDRAKSLLDEAESLANEAILRTDCFGLFGSRSDGLTAAQVLAGMESGTAYGKIQFIYNPNDTSVATTRPTISLGNVFGVTSTVTKINAGQVGPGYWNNGDAGENADTLLHELGHALRFLGFKGGDFQQNDKDDTVNQQNSELIREKCLK